ncbi:hypothetical protein ESCO_001436 [Escovopsis weberi]|uniref:Oxidase ustYa n=1 Tax=Escovopsis weberi TaxID=150374 RepID=A0A0N0RU33_ESCWE|nr:hypothetical protein ESCO_001436 [Escovopsis weberi]
MGYISMNKVAENGDIPQVIQVMSTDGSGRFCVAAFHQLHCLYLIWEDYRRAMSAGDAKSSSSTEGEHSAHCFDYLRESIICAADNSLEPFRSPFDGGGTQGNGVDGFGTVHQCRDFRLLYDWSEKFRYSDGHDAHKFEG